MEERHDEIVIYQSEDGLIKVDVLFENETVWLTMDQMCLLFGKAKSTISEHIQNIYAEGELKENETMRKFGISEYSTKPTSFYNLDVIISVGYRVKSHQGTQFRIWATQRLRDYIIKGVALNDERFKRGNSMNQRSILEDAGRISHELALQKANEEYQKYQAKRLEDQHLESLKELESDLKMLDGK